MATVIIGAGIVGVSTAYYLATESDTDSDTHPIHLVETTDRLFASASGYAGGFLARDWFAPAVADVAALSFDLHRALADQHDGRSLWGYAASTALSYGLPLLGTQRRGERRRGEDWLRQGSSRSTAAPAAAAAAAEATENGSLPAWLHRQPGDSVEVLADDGTTAQVDPLLLCQFLLRAAQARGVQLHQPARAVAVGFSGGGSGELASVTLEEGGPGATAQTVLPCTRLVIAAGAWTPHVFETLFPLSKGGRLLNITNYAGHSLVVRPRPTVSTPTVSHSTAPPHCHAVFAAGGALAYCPEIFGRANGTLYMAGLNSSTEPLPRRATDAVPDPAKLDDLLAACKSVLANDNANDDVEIVRAGLCHRPATPWGLPLVLRMPDAALHTAGGRPVATQAGAAGAAGGVFVAAGHGPWGISMGPGTGKVLAELVQGRPLSADISGLGCRCTE